MSTPSAQAERAAPTGTRDEQLTSFVGSRVAGLQRGYLADESGAVGALARLRRAVASGPGEAPEVWGETLAGLPPALAGREDEASAFERAAHAAITVYAMHQQSKRGLGMGMHRPRQSLGTAVSALSDRLGDGEAVRRRFLALGTASSLPETLHHLRGLVTQFRGESIPLDYGLLARDLRRLQNPRTAGGVRLAWGRDFYRVRVGADPDASSPSTTGTTTPSTSGDH